MIKSFGIYRSLLSSFVSTVTDEQYGRHLMHRIIPYQSSVFSLAARALFSHSIFVLHRSQ